MLIETFVVYCFIASCVVLIQGNSEFSGSRRLQTTSVNFQVVSALPSSTWSSVYTSSNGVNIAACESSSTTTGYIWISSNSGSTFVKSTGLTTQNWKSVAISQGGTYVFGLYSTTYYRRSTDGGQTSSFVNYAACANVVMNDGGDVVILAGTATTCKISYSTNYGSTFSTAYSPGYIFVNIAMTKTSSPTWVAPSDTNGVFTNFYQPPKMQFKLVLVLLKLVLFLIPLLKVSLYLVQHNTYMSLHQVRLLIMPYTLTVVVLQVKFGPILLHQRL